MIARAGLGLLGALLWSWAGAEEAGGPATQDPDLDLIPQAAQQNSAGHLSAANPVANQRLYLENAFSA